MVTRIRLSDFPVPVQIVIVGFIAGLFVGIGVETGVQPDETSIGILVLKTFCETFSDIDTTEGKFATKNCYLNLFFMIVLSIIITIVSIWTQINRVSDWKIGAFLYGIGWVIGLLLIFLN